MRPSTPPAADVGPDESGWEAYGPYPEAGSRPESVFSRRDIRGREVPVQNIHPVRTLARHGGGSPLAQADAMAGRHAAGHRARHREIRGRTRLELPRDSATIGRVERLNRTALVRQDDTRRVARSPLGERSLGRRFAQELAVRRVAEIGTRVAPVRGHQERPRNHCLRFQAFETCAGRTLGRDDRSDGRFEIHSDHRHHLVAGSSSPVRNRATSTPLASYSNRPPPPAMKM